MQRIEYIAHLQSEQQKVIESIEKNQATEDSALMDQQRSKLNRIEHNIQVQIDKLEKEAIMPPSAAQAFHRLGAEDIFVKLYALSAQIKPLAEGKIVIDRTNESASAEKEAIKQTIILNRWVC